MSWEGSTRAKRLPKDWPRIRNRILRRDPICKECRQKPSNEVDHIQPGDDHRDTNLRGICQPCHQRKSAQEGWQASHPPRKRQAERHPGLRGDT